MEQGWKKGVGDLGRVYYRGAKGELRRLSLMMHRADNRSDCLSALAVVTAGEAKKQGKSHYLSNDLEMLSEVIRLRPDLIKAKLCELGWDA